MHCIPSRISGRSRLTRRRVVALYFPYNQHKGQLREPSVPGALHCSQVNEVLPATEEITFYSRRWPGFIPFFFLLALGLPITAALVKVKRTELRSSFCFVLKSVQWSHLSSQLDVDRRGNGLIFSLLPPPRHRRWSQTQPRSVSQVLR